MELVGVRLTMVQKEGTAIFAKMAWRPALVRAVRMLVVIFWSVSEKVHGSQTTTMCQPVVNGVNVAGLCARSPVCQLHARSRGLGCLAKFLMMMRPDVRYPKLWINVQEMATGCSSLSHWKYLQQTTKAFMLGRGQGMSRSVPLSESPFEE